MNRLGSRLSLRGVSAWGVRLLLAGTLGVAGVAKMNPRSGTSGVLADLPVLRTGLGLLEVGIAVALVTARFYRLGREGAAAFLVLSSLFVISLELTGSTTGCGCFGGWVHLDLWSHLLILGVGLILYSLLPHELRKVSTV